MKPSPLRLPSALLPLFGLAACASQPAPAWHFVPATQEQALAATAAWSTARDRAATLPASRLLYDAKLSSQGAPSVPGTLAVVYDGATVVNASLTGPFGSRIAEYRDGAVTGEDRQAFVTEPSTLRAVLSGVWTTSPPMVAGRDAGVCELSWTENETRVVAVLDVALERVLRMELSGGGAALSVEYSGTLSPWPERIALREEKTSRGLALRLVAVEPGIGTASPGP